MLAQKFAKQTHVGGPGHKSGVGGGQPVPGNRILRVNTRRTICAELCRDNMSARSSEGREKSARDDVATRVPSIDLCGFDFACCRGGSRVPDQVIATTISSGSSSAVTGTAVGIITVASSAPSSTTAVDRPPTTVTAPRPSPAHR